MAERLLLEAIAAVDGCLERWWTECQKPRDRDATASMYAEIAHRLGWLELDRTLSQAEFERLNWSRLPPDQLPPGKHRLADRVGRGRADARPPAVVLSVRHRRGHFADAVSFTPAGMRWTSRSLPGSGSIMSAVAKAAQLSRALGER